MSTQNPTPDATNPGANETQKVFVSETPTTATLTIHARPTPDATATPRTNEAVIRRFKSWEICDRDNIYVEADFARTLERELIACQNEIRGILDECAKHITLSNDFPWSEEVYCAFRAIRREIADTKKQANDEFDAIITRNMELEKQLTAAKAEIARVTADFDRVTSTLYDRVNDVIALKDRAERAEAEVRRLQEQMRNRLVEVQEQQQGGITT